MSREIENRRFIRYFERNIPKIFMIGVFVASVFLAVHIVITGIDSQQFKLNVKASIEVSYMTKDNVNITKKDCITIIEEPLCEEQIKAYLGENTTYDEFKKNINFEMKNNSFIVSYIDGAEVKARSIVRFLSSKITNKLLESEKVTNINKKSIPKTEQIKVFEDARINMKLIYFVEIGFVLGIFIGIIVLTIVYYSNGRIKKKVDVEDELHLRVLAEIPYFKNN